MDNLQRAELGRICSINDSIWVAAALISYEKYFGSEECRNINDYSIPQSEIRVKAAALNNLKVEAARTSQWCNGDHKEHTYAYLCATDSNRRLSFPNEFPGDKCEPELDKNIEIDSKLGKIKLQQIYDFVHNEYAAMETQIINDIDYIWVLNYLNENQNIPYARPDKTGLTLEEKDHFLEMKKKGTKAIEELKKMMMACEKKYGLIKGKNDTPNWLDGSYTKTRLYLWAQMKNKEFELDPSSISIFVEKNGENNTIYRISLEIRNDKTSQEIMNRYHSYLNMSIDSDTGLVLVEGSNEWGCPKVINESQESVKAKIKDGTYKKVQLCKYIERKPDETNEYYHEELLKAVGLLLPYYEYQLGIKSGEKTIQTKLANDVENIKMNKTKTIGLNTILYGPPGTGKTYHSAIYAVAICDGESIEEVEKKDYKDVMTRYNALKAEKRIAFTTFHQSYGYEEFIEGIKPVIEAKETESETSEAKKSDIGYTIEPGVFKKFCEKAKGDAQPYVFIIDEINRGNISKIFGELITLIETTKRDGMAEGADAILPYSGEAFSVPSNVYILGTMNTADRSIALMDTALRRRFNFEEMMPDPSVIDGIKVESLDVATMLRTINTRIEYLYDREHTIGHAFFTKLRTNPSLEVLAEIFRNNVVPLLQEYFYEDYEKIQLVLGDNDKSSDTYKFILDKKVNENEIFKKSPQLDLHEKTYVIQEDAFYNLQSYLEISEVRKAEEQSE